jgi:hypothetical protein
MSGETAGAADSWHARTAADTIAAFETTAAGLSSGEAANRLRRHGARPQQPARHLSLALAHG